MTREYVPRGSVGVVTATGIFSDTRVRFTVTSVFADKEVEIRVERGEVQLIS